MNEQIKFYSQIGQDFIVASLMRHKTSGTFLDIGCNHPENINNTYALEKYLGWRGVSIDFDERWSHDWEHVRPQSKFILSDATKIDYLNLLEENNLPVEIDFLSLDVDPPDITFDVLKILPLDKIKFNIIAYEHDGYRMGEEFKNETRKYISDYDYLLFRELNNQDDIWVHSSFAENFK